MKNLHSHKFIPLAFQILAAALSLFFVSINCFAADGADIRTKADIPANLSGKTVIIQTNDIHGQMWSYQKTARLKQELRERGANVILVDLGDYSVGTVDVSSTNGRSAISAMNSAGYDLATIGNHEFDYTYGELKNNLASAHFTNICANVLGDNGSSILQPNVLISNSGLSIGFFGLCTPQTPLQLEPSFTQGLKFLSGEDLYACAQEQTDLLKSRGADLVICLSHLGQDRNAKPVNSSSIDLFANTHGINLILDSHSHTAITSGPGKEPIQAAGVYYEYVGIVIINNASGRIEDRFLITTDESAAQNSPDAEAIDAAISGPVDKKTPDQRTDEKPLNTQEGALQPANEKAAAPDAASQQPDGEKNSSSKDPASQQPGIENAAPAQSTEPKPTDEKNATDAAAPPKDPSTQEATEKPAPAAEAPSRSPDEKLPASLEAPAKNTEPGTPVSQNHSGQDSTSAPPAPQNKENTEPAKPQSSSQDAKAIGIAPKIIASQYVAP
ncbi:MAG: metallophosphoesterase [Butyrivibrio sp.]|nr:metallophosphoesterase [Butyrivibrio sp.]